MFAGQPRDARGRRRLLGLDVFFGLAQEPLSSDAADGDAILPGDGPCDDMDDVSRDAADVDAMGATEPVRSDFSSDMLAAPRGAEMRPRQPRQPALGGSQDW